jgi:hypothetical protein
MKTLIATLSAALFATVTYAGNIPQPQTPGSPQAEAAAEAIHNARQHGIDNSAKQPQAQMAGSAKAEAVAEATHLKKTHGQINNSADQRLEFDHPNH